MAGSHSMYTCRKQGRMKEIVSLLSETVSTTLADMGRHKPTVMGEIDGLDGDSS
ncbi:hypothetical protein L208DRAFT_1396068 [Tricholoma matsutake]|nr:hypothetical protein L208DRAFT_1396068 [Tricholoma matsutake 945]